MGKVIRPFCWHQNFVPWALSAPAPGLYTCIKSWKKKKNGIKEDFKKIFLKLATNDPSGKIFLLTSKLRPQWVVSPCPGSLYMYKMMKKKLYKIRLQRNFLKLVANDRTDKRFLLTSKLSPKVVCPRPAAINLQQMTIVMRPSWWYKSFALMGCLPLSKGYVYTSFPH